ncbi:inositol 2-dehydrogenase [Campylobacter sp. MIT 21-1685]|uniref:inositol 2-dehydrogenase n=1 Tax=unclassified Campylobacter TaxID=2593542 RepID=UPI00224AC1AD|nr:MULTISPECIES: inositol 2-dehydrogenase [unclassified Campylobacter]MCX2682512.1 inositol 2-dehydrogenase [Campylobacter sp. MIT 21-1684]MCX2750775.1 inositol 2-dehydrogenase [Campylobacter sp. MIT 21-1682]MCX2806993.1 inositol 2-dehydrogenase [Campylobacter sp. MIT 21-1685]
MRQIRIGVFGTGRIGKIHIKNLLNHPQVILKAVSDPFIDKDFLCTLNGTVYKEKDELLQDNEIEAVFICTPSDTHYELIKEALRAKKAVFCEKPIELDLNRILEIKQILKETQGFLQVGFNRRFDANFHQIAKLVSEGEVGDIIQIHIISRDFSPPSKAYVESSGGIFLDMSIHDFDMLAFITKSQVEEIFVSGRNFVTDYDDIDTATMTLHLSNGALAVIENCRQAVYGYDQRLEVFGKKGRVFCENKYENSVTLCNSRNQNRQNPLDFFLERYIDSYKNELDDFITNFCNGKKPSVGIEESIQSTLVALAAAKSLQTKSLVCIDEFKKQYKIGE